MEVNCSSLIELGELETKMRQVYQHHDCVELPSSWPATDADLCKLSFLLPVCSESVDSLAKQETSESVPQKIPIEEREFLAYGEPVKSAALTDDVHVGANMVEMSTSSKENNVKPMLKESVITECHLTSPSEKKLNAVVNDSTAHFSTLANHTDKQEATESTSEVLHASTECASKINSKDTVVSSDTNDENIPENGLVSVDGSCLGTLNTSIGNENTSQKDFESSRTNAKSEHEPVKSKSSSKEPGKPKPPTTTWAGLFHTNSSSNKTNIVNNVNGYIKGSKLSQKSSNNKANADIKTVSNIKQPTVREPEPESVKLVKTEEDPNAKLLGMKLSNMELIFKPQAFMPRGLINTSNWCYINATLQALLVCPPFYQLLKNLPIIPAEKRQSTSTPIMNSFIQLASEFRPLSSKRGYQSNKEVRQGIPFEPRYIYDMLTVIKSSLSERGSQEDAEEFQSCVLNGLHEEVTKLLNNLNKSEVSSSSSVQQNKEDVDFNQNAMYEDVDENDVPKDEWEEVVTTKKNRSAVTRRADISRTPISEMFRGELCTLVFRPGQKVSISYEPFFSLPLYVPSEHSTTIEDALCSLTDKEGFSEEDQSNHDATRQQTIETLPPVLVLHLKRFIYDKQGGSKKIDRKVDYKTDLVIGKDLLSKSARKANIAQRSYKLFAVVYHHGEKATGGHYTTDVFHIGLSSWLRIDDQSIWSIPHNEVTRHNSNRTAYLLYYRRTDLG